MAHGAWLLMWSENHFIRLKTSQYEPNIFIVNCYLLSTKKSQKPTKSWSFIYVNLWSFTITIEFLLIEIRGIWFSCANHCSDRVDNDVSVRQMHRFSDDSSFSITSLVQKLCISFDLGQQIKFVTFYRFLDCSLPRFSNLERDTEL